MAASYILGPFRLDAETDTLFRSGEPVSLGRRAVALLRVLVEQRGIPVSKDALMDAAWAGLTVGESNLAVQIAALRRVLGEEPGGDSWIETLPRRGYRFVGPASARDQGAVTAASQAAKFPVAVGSSNLASGPPPRTPERRHITALAAELAPAPGGRLPADPEDLAAIVGGFRGQASDALTRHGGVIGESRGREMLAYFGYPTAHENDAERAVRAALAIQRGLAQHNVENAGKDAPELSARIGLECGLVVVDSTGEMIGDAAHVASRVQTAAEPGSVLVTTNVLRQVPGLFVTEERGSRELEGVSEPVNLFLIVRASGGGRRAAARSLTPFVGREEELGLLTRRWERARAGEGQLVLIVGEPGIGKSRLVEEFRTKIAETSHTWTVWSALQLLQNTPLHPIAEWGRQRFLEDASAEERLADLEGALRMVGLNPTEHAPLLAPIVDIPLPTDRAPNLPPEEMRRRQLAAIVAWILAGARSQPLAIAFEDLHWADPTSLDLICALAERSGQAPLFIIATARPEFRPPWSLRSHHGVISLSPLDRADVAQMVGELAARHALSKEVVEGVSERTGGVPLFVEEVTRLLLERGEGGGAHLIPPTLQQSLAARLDRLGEAREVAQIGAVLGRSFSYALLRDVASASAVAEAGLLSALDKLADADLLIAEGAGHEANYRFKHALIQDAAYDSLLKSRRQALHRRAAEILRDSLERAAVEPEVIAHHFTEARLDDLAIEWWGRAGDQALRRSAFQEAIAHLGKAIAMADKAGAASTPPAFRREQIKLQVALITPLIHVKGYAAPETKAAAEGALLLIEQAEALGEPPEDPLLLFSVLFALWSASYVSFNGYAMRELSAQFLALAEKQGTTVPLMIGHRIVGISLTCTGDLTDGRRHLDRAIALYDPTEHRPLATRFGVDARMAVLSYRSRALWLLGYPDAALTDSDQALSDARAVGQAATLMYALGHAPLTFFQCGNYATANEIFDELTALADEKGTLLWKALGMMNQGWLFALMSKASEAVHMITSGISALRSTGATLWVPLLLSYLARSHAELGQFDDAWRCISEATIAVETRKERWCEAEVSRVTGEIALMSPAPDAAKAETYFEHALSIARDQQAKSWELRAAMSMARLWRDQGKRQQAHDLLASVYGWFTEGFDTLDLKEAKALLEQLRA